MASKGLKPLLGCVIFAWGESLKGRLMRHFKCLLLLLLYITTPFLIACGAKLDRVVNVQIVGTPMPAPTPALAYKLIEGSAFIRDKGDVKVLSGLKVQLVRSQEFEPRFEETKRNILLRHLSFEIFTIEQNINEKKADTESKAGEIKQVNTRWSAIKSQKENELKRCLDVGWSEFIYIDPITNQHLKGSRFDNKTVTLMTLRIAQVGDIIREKQQSITDLQLNCASAIRDLNVKREEYIGKMKAVGGNRVSSDDCERLYNENRALFEESGMDGLQYRCVQDIIQAIDQSTLDCVYTDSKGEFAFKVKKMQDYICYASDNGKDPEGSYSWLIPVKLEDGEFRKVIVSDTNSIDRVKWLELMRAENMKRSLKLWISNY